MTDELTTTEARDVGPLGFARMSGLSIAARDAAPWATDFLNAAYYRRPVAERAVDDLRAAFCVLTTYWYRKASGRRLHAADLRAFHRAYGRERFATEASARGTLSRAQLTAGAAGLLGTGSPRRTPTPPGAAGASRSRRWKSATPTTRAAGWRWPAWAS